MAYEPLAAPLYVRLAQRLHPYGSERYRYVR